MDNGYMRCVNSPFTMAGKLPVAYQWISWLKLNHGKKALCFFFAIDGYPLVSKQGQLENHL